MDDSSALAVAESMISNRIRERTAKGYRNKLAMLGRWLAANGQAVDDTSIPVLPLHPELTISFFGELVKPRVAVHPVFGKPKPKLLKNGGHVSASTAGGFKSAIIWLYTERKQVIDTSLNKQMNLFISGYKKTVGDLKQDGTMSCFEGKRPLSFEGYKLLCSQFFRLAPGTSSEGNHRGDGATFAMGMFAWAFLVLQWNLIAR